MKRKISCLLALCMSLMGTVPFVSSAGTVASAASQSEYVINLGSDVEFNRVQLVWDEAQSGEVSVTAGDTTLTGTADGTELDLTSDKITNGTASEPPQSFERESITAGTITVTSASKPRVRLYKDEKLNITYSASSALNETNKLFDGVKGNEDNIVENNAFGSNVSTYANIEPTQNEDDTYTYDIKESYVTGNLDGNYNVSELVVYTWGSFGWYPKSYNISIDGAQAGSITTLDPTTANNYPSYKPYVLTTPVSGSGSSIKVTFPDGGWSDARNTTAGQKKYGFRIFEIEAYGSKAPIWVSDDLRTYTFTAEEAAKADKVNVTYDGGASGTALVKVNDRYAVANIINNTASIELTAGEKTAALNISVASAGGAYPRAELVKAATLTVDDVSLADAGRIVVPTTLSTGTSNGAQPTSENDYRSYKALFDKDTSILPTNLSERPANYLGRRMLFYWNKYKDVTGVTEYDLSDCYAWFTLKTSGLQRITKIQLISQNGQQTASDKVFISDYVDDEIKNLTSASWTNDTLDYAKNLITAKYGSGYDVSVSTGTYAYDNANYNNTDASANYANGNQGVMTVEPNTEGQYITFLLYGIKSTTHNNTLLLEEVFITVDEVVARRPQYVIDLGESMTFNRVQLAWDEAQTGNVWVDLQNSGATSKSYSQGINNEKTVNFYDSSIISSGTVQSFSRTDLTADKIIVYANSEPSVKLYNDKNLRSNITAKSAANFADTDASNMFDGDTTSTLLEAKRDTSAAPASSVSGTFDAEYDISEFVLYTRGNNGWYPISYKISNTEGAFNVTGTPTKVVTADAPNYPNYAPYTLATDLNVTTDNFIVSFPEGGYNDIEKTTSHSFRIYEIEFYGSKLPVYMSDMQDYTFTAAELADAESLNIGCDDVTASALIKVNGTYTNVDLVNGSAVISLPSDAKTNGVTVSVPKLNGKYPQVSPIIATEIELGKTVSFNRVKLEWSEAQSGGVSVDIVADGATVKTLTGAVAGKASLNLFDSVIGQTDLDTVHKTYSNNFTRTSFDAAKIVVHSVGTPTLKLYNDINIKQQGAISNITATNLNQKENMFDGKNEYNTNYATYYTSNTDKVSSSVSATLDKVYDISEFVLYTWGIDRWYPTKYSIKIGDTETEGTATLEGTSYPYNPYILTTTVNAASDRIAVTVPEGGYATNNSTLYNGFRIYEAEFYGSEAPVWPAEPAAPSATGKIALKSSTAKSTSWTIQVATGDKEVSKIQVYVDNKEILNYPSSGTVAAGTTVNFGILVRRIIQAGNVTVKVDGETISLTDTTAQP